MTMDLHHFSISFFKNCPFGSLFSGHVVWVLNYCRLSRLPFLLLWPGPWETLAHGRLTIWEDTVHHGGEGMAAGTWGTLVSGQGTVDRMRLGHTISRPTVCVLLPSVKLSFLKLLQLSKWAPPAGNQVFKPEPVGDTAFKAQQKPLETAAINALSDVWLAMVASYSVGFPPNSAACFLRRSECL